MKLNKLILKAINEGIELSLLLFDDEISFTKSNSNLTKKNLSNNLEYIKWINDNFVDLGLPSGTLWSKNNLGASNENTPKSWYGNYYAWGELKPKLTYSDEKYYEFMSNATILPLSNDVIYQTYSKLFSNQKIPVMPTHEQVEELVKYTSSEWVENHNGVSELNGRLFIGKNNNQIFIPACGYIDGQKLIDDHDYCFLWTKSINPGFSDRAWNLYFNSTSIYPYSTDYRYYGLTVRGVIL